jgi:DNA-binding NarL/FixJ family response regulator
VVEPSRAGLSGSRFEVVGRCGDPSELLALVREHRPDLVIVDIRMPPMHTTEGLDAARVIRRELPETGILILSARAEVAQATELLASGSRSGYLLKSRTSDVDDFLATHDRIVKGAAVVDPTLVQGLVAARRADDPLGSSRRANARCLRRWPRDGATPASPISCR